MPATPTRRVFLIPKFPMALAVTALLGLGACAPIGLAVGAGAGVGVAAAQERGVAGRTSDLRTEARIFEKFFNADLELQTDLGVEVYEGRVLLTGATDDVRLADKAVKLAWQVDGVSDVINEIQLRKSGAKDFSSATPGSPGSYAPGSPSTRRSWRSTTPSKRSTAGSTSSASPSTRRSSAASSITPAISVTSGT